MHVDSTVSVTFVPDDVEEGMICEMQMPCVLRPGDRMMLKVTDIHLNQTHYDGSVQSVVGGPLE